MKSVNDSSVGNFVDFVKKHLERGGLQAAVFPAGLVPGLYGELAERARSGEIAPPLLEEGTLRWYPFFGQKIGLFSEMAPKDG